MLKAIKYNFYVLYIRIPYKILSGDLKFLIFLLQRFYE